MASTRRISSRLTTDKSFDIRTMGSGIHHESRRMAGRDPHEAHRAATPLELLFDLTFATSFGLAASSCSSIFLRRMITQVRPLLVAGCAAPTERRGVLGAPFSDGPVRRSERSGRSEVIWLDSEPAQLRLQGLSRHPEYGGGPVCARDTPGRLSQCAFDHGLLVGGEIRGQSHGPRR